MRILISIIIAAMCSILSAQTELNITASFSDTVWLGIDYTPAVFSLDDKIIVTGHGATQEIALTRANLMKESLLDMGFDENMIEISTVISNRNVTVATQLSNSYVPGSWDYPLPKE